MQTLSRAASVVAITLLSLGVATNVALAQTAKPAAKGEAAKQEFTPQVGQEGKDVIWVPTPQSLVDRMLTMAQVKSTDYVIDLGSGDGRTVITAAKKFGANALGIEYNPDMVELAKRNADKEGVSGKAHFMKADIFATDFSKATVITMYLLPSLNVKLRPTLLNMKPGTRVVSHAFTMDDWEPDQVDSSEGRTAYLWIVPAKVAGTWKLDGAAKGEITLTQQYQKVGGGAKVDGKVANLLNPRLRGDAITFSLDGREYSGRVHGDKIEGSVAGGGKFSASKS
ncbi:MAG TPA: class I SAM-dependent methyltransferase [Burkholderiales bacterium]|nr:class I SAM-dependent methyltransferase [Burkholderiales bacterium]